MIVERLRRAWCRWFGHRWLVQPRTAVVGPIAVCLRCGKYERVKELIVLGGVTIYSFPR